MATPVFKNGSGGNVVADSQTLNIKRWSYREHETGEVDTTHSGSAGYDSSISNGAKVLEGDFEAVWDSANNMYADPPDLSSGKVPAIVLYFGNSAVYADCPNIRITESSVENVIKGAITFRCSFKTTGAYTLPTT